MNAALIKNGLLSIYIDAMEISNRGTVWVNEKGVVVGSNKKFAEQLGYTKSTLEGKIIFEINPHLTMLNWRQLWQKIVAKKRPVTRVEHLTVSNHLIPVQVRWELVELEGTIYTCGVVEDLISSSRFEDLLDIASDTAKVAAWEWDLVHNTFFFTKHLRSLLQLPEDFILKADNIVAFLRDMLSSSSLKKLEGMVKEAMKNGIYFETELELTVDNPAVPAQINFAAKPLHLEGRTVKMYGTIQDVSSISGRTSELYLMSFCMDYATECIIWVDQTGVITYANHAAALTYDYVTKELKGLSIASLVPSFNENKYEEYWQELSERGMIEGEEKHLKKGGEFFIAWVSHNYISYQESSFNCIFFKDLTVQKEREESWKLSMLTIQQASDMIFWMDTDGHIFYTNQAASSILGYTMAQLMKLTIYDLSPSINKEEWPAHLEQIQAKKHASYESLLRRKSGKLFPVAITINLVAFENQTIISLYANDISERKKEALKLELAYEEIQRLKSEVEEENMVLKEDIKLKYAFENIITVSESYKGVLKKVEQVAESDATVLILGETGTGKELIARAVHQLSKRSEKSMIKINCGALPANLIESELFGHEKGAFTGAVISKKGRFELAHKGTIFLDEIGELPLELQTKLLRVLQEGEFERVGGIQTIQVDVRVIAATNRNLDQKVKEASFREDLFYRLNVFPIVNMSLRERKEDIPALVRFFVDKYSKKMGKKIKEIPASALKKLSAYDFPGNVRELENIIERAIIISDKNRLLIDNALFRQPKDMEEDILWDLDELQKRHITKALKATNGRVSGSNGAAALLEINPKTLTSRMAKLGIKKQDYITV